jgi:hypothetical protein
MPMRGHAAGIGIPASCTHSAAGLGPHVFSASAFFHTER